MGIRRERKEGKKGRGGEEGEREQVIETEYDPQTLKYLLLGP